MWNGCRGSSGFTPDSPYSPPDGRRVFNMDSVALHRVKDPGVGWVQGRSRDGSSGGSRDGPLDVILSCSNDPLVARPPQPPSLDI